MFYKLTHSFMLRICFPKLHWEVKIHFRHHFFSLRNLFFRISKYSGFPLSREPLNLVGTGIKKTMKQCTGPASLSWGGCLYLQCPIDSTVQLTQRAPAYCKPDSTKVPKLYVPLPWDWVSAELELLCVDVYTPWDFKIPSTRRHSVSSLWIMNDRLNEWITPIHPQLPTHQCLKAPL